MKKRYWLAILCAALALVLTVAAASADTGDVYGLMTDVNGLHDGDRIILVSDDGSNYQAMATDFSGMQVTLTDNTITEQNGMLALTLTETDDGWLLASNDGYLAVNGGALTIVSDSASASVWTISIASDGTATVSCTGDAIVFAEQDGAYRFFCGEGGNEIAIYNASLETEQHPFGGGLWWSFADGKLTIGGSGAMPDFSSNSQPWNQLLSNITEVEIQNGVTRIGNESFSHCNGFSEITIPDSVTSIGYRTFQDCRGLIEIKIPDCVTSVGGDAFSGTGWWNSQSNGIVYLDYILLGVKGTCGQIARIKEGTRLIAPQAFLDQSQVSKVTIPDSATSIGSWAFSGCTRLQSVTIGNGVTSIESHAFYNCTALTSITMPCSASIGYDAFVYCTGITSVHLTKGTGTMVEYSSAYTNTPWYRSRENAITITLDDGIQNIGNYAFGNCTGLSEFTIPDSVTSISYAAFYGCTGLSEITIPDSVTSIGNMAFYNCTGLTSVTIGNDVTSIGIQAFSGCTAMTDVYYLGTESERIRNLYISSGNDYLLNATWHYNSTGPAPFTLVIDGGNVYDNIVISNGKALLAVPVKLKGTIEKPVFGMGFDLLYDPEQLYFSGATNFNIIVNGTNEGLLNCAYINYLGIVITEETEIMTLYFTLSKDIETGTEIAFMLKEGGYAETGSTLTPTTWDIEADFLPYIVNEHEHVPGETVRELEVEPTCTAEGGYDEVVYCTVCGEELSREHIDTPALGHDLVHHDAKAPTCTEIGWEAYDTCSRCDYTTYEEVPPLGHDLVHHDAKAATCTEIGWEEYDTCSRCDYTTYVELSNLGHDLVHHDAKEPTCTETGWEAYDTCSRCDYTTYEEIPALGHNPGEPVHENETEPTCTEGGQYDEVVYCTRCGEELSRETVTVDALGHAPGEPVHENEVEPTETTGGYYDEVVYCTRCGLELGREHIKVPPLWDPCGGALFCFLDPETGTLSIKGTGTMFEQDDLPWNDHRNEIRTIVIESGATEIGERAFSHCVNLRTVTIPSSVTGIGDYAFYGCKALRGIALPAGLTVLGASAFESCTGLAEITIPDGVTSIGEDAFFWCTALESVTLPCSAEVERGAFDQCVSLTSIHVTKGTGTWVMTANNDNPSPWAYSSEKEITVILDDGIQNIGKKAFMWCEELVSITIPQSVTSIDEHAFSGCIGLTEITLPDGLTTIGYEAFRSCTGLSEITIPDSVTEIDTWAFSSCTALRTVTLGNRLAKIGGSAFYHCPDLTDVWYHGTRRMRAAMEIMPNNTWLTDAEWHYLPVNAIEWKALPEKQEYLEGEAIDVTGGAITTYYDYDIVEEESLTADMVSGFDNTTAGEQTLTVSFDGKTLTYEVTVHHIPGDPVIENEVDPTCTEEGHYDEVVYCSGCGEELNRNTVTTDALGHIPGEPVIENEVAPTYTADGSYDEVIYCTRCSAELERHTHTVDRLPFEGTVEWNAEDVQFKGTTAYVIANRSAQTPRFTVKNSEDGSVVDPANYDYEYCENINAGTGYVIVTFKDDYTGTARGWFKIYLPATTETTVENISDGIRLTWKPVEGAAGYVIYRRAWSSTTNGWTTFERWNNTTETTYIDGADANHKVYAGTRYQYGVKAYFARRTDPVTGATIGGNVGDNFNLGEVGPLKTTVRITTRVLNSVTAGTKQMTVKWSPSKNFTGYQIKYATDANFTKNVKAFKISDPKAAQTVIDSLKSGTTYYVTIRSYHEFNGMTYFGEWSNVLSCKVK